MDPDCDLVEKVLQTTGLSCDDLMLQLQQYRTKKSQTQDECSNSSKEDASNIDSIRKLCLSYTNKCRNVNKTNTDSSNKVTVLEAIDSQKNTSRENDIEDDINSKNVINSTKTQQGVSDSLEVSNNDITISLVNSSDSDDCDDISIIGDTTPNKIQTKSVNIISSLTFSPPKNFLLENDDSTKFTSQNQKCESSTSLQKDHVKWKTLSQKNLNSVKNTEDTKDYKTQFQKDVSKNEGLENSHVKLSSPERKEISKLVSTTLKNKSNLSLKTSYKSLIDPADHNSRSYTPLDKLASREKSRVCNLVQDSYPHQKALSFVKEKEKNNLQFQNKPPTNLKQKISTTLLERTTSILKEQENLSQNSLPNNRQEKKDSTQILASPKKNQDMSIQSTRISLSVPKRFALLKETEESKKYSTILSKDISECKKNELSESQEKITEHKEGNVDSENSSSVGEATDADLTLKDSSVTNSEDNLRNILRKQLSSLRNMKKSNEILPDLKKSSTFLTNLNKKRKSCDARSLNDNLKEETEISENVIEEVEENKDISSEEIEDRTVTVQEDIPEKKINQFEEIKNEGMKFSSNENSLVSLSDETEFIILDVTGGVDRLTPLISEPEFGIDEDRNFASITNTDQANNESIANSTEPETFKNKKIEVNLDGCTDSKSLRGEPKLPNLTVKKNMSENFIRDPGINKSVKNSEKSPFVSDSLEDFLNENAELRISYAIPKLGAEEGIGEKTKKSPFDNVISNNKIPRSKQQAIQKEKPKFKAKTLAEMRRQMLKMEAKEKDISIRPKKKFKEYIINKQVSKVEEENDVKTDPKITENSLPRNSFILFNNKKIWVSSKIDNHLGVSQNLSKGKTPTLFGSERSRKLSILSFLDQQRTCGVTYKPGPLCKKAKLQNTSTRKNWITEVKNLPKIYLEIVPEYKKAIHPRVAHLLPIFDNVRIDEERIHFALTALQPKNENYKPQPFTFHIPYKNKQEQIVVRKPCPIQPPKQEIKLEEPQTEISNIIDGLITYIETKEIEESLLKEEDYQIEKNSDNRRTKLRLPSKRKKLNLELRRLNCKVIDVACDDNEVVHCTKSYCTLGCVCKSLLCESVFPNHCGRVECMFECKCPTIITKELQSNKLSPITVNHLEDKAKKNLAKVEKEFTQTLIHTENQAILVATAKMRRSLKPPKKYTDYIKDDSIFDNADLEETDLESVKCKGCEILLEDMNLSHIVPYCLAHHLYDCYCQGEELPTEKKDQIPKLRIMKIKDDQYVKVETCARIRRVFPEYKERNKNPIYNAKLHLKLKRKYERRKKSPLKEKEEREEKEVEEIAQIFEPTIPQTPKEVSRPSKRKQSFHIREELPLVPIKPIKPLPKPIKPLIKPEKRDKDKEFALQRRKKKQKTNYVPVFDGEIKLSLKDNADLIKIIGSKNATLEYLRILPWNLLVENYRSGKISIWAKDTQPSALLCNRMGYLPPKNFKDIKSVRDRNEIISWILNDDLPTDRPRELMHLILTPRHIHFLIAGYCLKKIKNEDLTQPKESLTVAPNDVVENNNKETLSVVSPESAKKNIPKLILIENVAKATSPPKFEIKNRIIKPTKIIISKKPLKKSPSVIKPELLKLPVGTSLYPVTPKTSNLATTPTKEVSFVIKKQVNKSAESDSSIPTIQQILSAQSFKTIKNSKVGNKRPTISSNLYEPPKKKLIIEKKLISESFSVAETEQSKEKPDDLVVLSADNVKKPTPMELNNIPDLEVFEIHPENSEIKNDKNTIKEKSVKIVKDTLLVSRSIKCSHKDMFNKNKILILTNKVFLHRNLYYHNGTKREELIVPLPTVSKNAKWRMIHLNSDFTYLNFIKSTYSIKYTDLMDIVKISNMNRFTVILRNNEFCSKFKHPQFGIFCVPTFQDRLFIGPYLSVEDHGIETLRYLQGDLVETQVFISMVGRKSSDKQPTWVFETSVQNSTPNETIIELTDDEEIIVDDSDGDKIQNNSFLKITKNSLMCYPFVDVLDLGDKMPKNIINRCVMTNIPHMGYFEAHQGTKMFEIYWPTGNKCYRFSNVNIGKTILQQYLSQVFCPIPKFLKINIIIMTTIAVQNCKPIDPKYFTEPGPYFCGEFGICKKDQVPKKVLKMCKITSLDDHLKAHLESEENDSTMLRIFSTFLMSAEELKKNASPSQILQWAISEIYILKKLEQNYLSEKKDLKNMIDKYSTEFKQKLKLFKEKVTKKVSETIEIPDSDEDEVTGNSADNLQKNSTTGKIQTNPPQNHGKSLLRPNLLMSGGHSLLKPTDTSEPSSVVQPVKISMKNTNFLLKRNSVLYTKIT